MRLREILLALEGIAPARYAFSFDRVGLQVGDPEVEVRRAVVSLDRSRTAVASAVDSRAELLLAHHPLLFSPLKSVVATDHVGRTVMDLVVNGIAFAAAHTNWDSARGGVNDALAHRLALSDLADFGGAAEVERLKLVIFVPDYAANRLIDALSEAGAGVIGDYRRCAFIGEGKGTFLGETGANPARGRPGRIETVTESRVEMTLRLDQRSVVERALRKSHPYEEPAYDFLLLPSSEEQPAGRVGTLAESTRLCDFIPRVESALGTKALGWGDPERRIRKVAVVGGSADGEWRAAQRAGADVLVTGEVKQHVALEAAESGFALLAAGHYATEQPGVEALRDRLAAACPSVEWRTFAPSPGFAGRPL